MNTDIDEINSEVRDSGTPAKKPEATFAIRWLKRIDRVVWFWSLLAGVGLISQIGLLVVSDEGALTIPGLGALFGISGTIAGAYVGGEKIVEKLRNRNGTSSN